MNYSEELIETMKKFYQSLSEKDRRRYAAIEARKLGHGGISYIARIFGCSRDTINQGMKQLESLEIEELQSTSIRKPGAGRKRALDTTPGLEDAFRLILQDYYIDLERMNIEQQSSGGVGLSQRKLALLLEERGYKVSTTVIKQLIRRYIQQG